MPCFIYEQKSLFSVLPWIRPKEQQKKTGGLTEEAMTAIYKASKQEII